MKCWKCGANLPENTSVCTYCGASTKRRTPVTNEGRAMRQAYDHFGAEKVFDRNSILPTALGDLLEDSKTLRNQMAMVMEVGVGKAYLEQLHRSGKPDDLFCNRVKTLMCDEAGLSAALAQKLMGYLDEMIGWEEPVKATVPPPQPEQKKPSAGTSEPRQRYTPPQPEVKKPGTGSRVQPPPQPPKPPVKPQVKPQADSPEKPGQTGGVPLLAKPVPQTQASCLVMFIAVALIGGGIAVAISGLVVPGVIMAAVGVFLDLGASPNLPKKIACARKGAALELSWEGAIAQYAIALNNQWVLTGSGNKAVMGGEYFKQYKPGESFRLTLAEITDTGDVKAMGALTLQQPKK